MDAKVPIETVIGVDEVTVWMWPNSSDTVTIRFDRERWEEIEEAADGDIEAYVSKLIIEDLEEN